MWYGSVNFLSYGTAEESIMRFESGDVAGELLDTVIKICKTLDVEPEEFYIVNSSQPK